VLFLYILGDESTTENHLLCGLSELLRCEGCGCFVGDSDELTVPMLVLEIFYFSEAGRSCSVTMEREGDHPTTPFRILNKFNKQLLHES
jgi:hypothetical protein